MAPIVKLHRCSSTWAKIGGHPCWKVQKALDEQGIEYEVVKEPAYPRSRRQDVIKATGQQRLPTIEFEDGTHYRAESDDMRTRIQEGKLFDRS